MKYFFRVCKEYSIFDINMLAVAPGGGCWRMGNLKVIKLDKWSSAGRGDWQWLLAF